MDKGSLWLWILAFGLISTLDGMLRLALDGFILRGVPVPAWTGWPTLFLGIVISVLAVRGFFHHSSKPSNTNAEAAKAKAKMDQMYFNEYGVWPDYKEEPEVLPKNQAKSGQAHLNPEADNANLKSTTPIDTKPPVD